MAATIVYLFSLISAFLLSVVQAGEYCYYYHSSRFDSDNWGSSRYCVYGCCGWDDTDCCNMSGGVIAGICVGVGVFIFVIIITICICRRRRTQGIVYRSGPAANAVVVQSTTTNQSGYVTTAGVQPGVMYPQYQYPGYSNTGYPAAGYPQGTTYPPPAYPPQPQPYAQGPPSYSEVTQGNGAGGVNNPGFEKN